MFKKIDEETSGATESPCKSCWREIRFASACESDTWRITNFNGINEEHFDSAHIHQQEIFVFEVYATHPV